MERELIIVGIDPGTTFGISIVNIDGKIIFSESIRNAEISEIIKKISEFGKPIIIATDKKKIPKVIYSIASSFGAKIWYPKEDISIKTKTKIIEEINKNNISIDDLHIRDSIVAAISAYRYLATMLSNIDKNLIALNLEKYSKEVKRLILEKKANNIDAALKLIFSCENLILRPEKLNMLQNVSKNFQEESELLRKIKILEKDNESLREYTKTLENRIRELEKQKEALLNEERIKNENARKEILKQKEIRARDILIKQLLYELKRKKEIVQKFEEQKTITEELKDIINNNRIPVILINNFKAEEIQEIKEKFNINISDFVLMFKNYEPSLFTAKYLSKIKPKAVIINEIEKSELLEKFNIPLLNNLKINNGKFFSWIEKTEFETALSNLKKKKLLNIIEKYKEKFL
ncbi:MAG: DUF460 domain-containing protein [Candidatus Aenigmatarchaeota archaeon]|nr:DUF460 domain-containing protein [Candidatus Aenigmarchaeota archaeon]